MALKDGAVTAPLAVIAPLTVVLPADKVPLMVALGVLIPTAKMPCKMFLSWVYSACDRTTAGE